jgi:hypothetical protein
MRTGEEAIERAAAFMGAFAERTGLGSERPPQRYLWTDAFAVCNFLALARETGEERYTALALALVDQVHQVLGRYRADDLRSGWISGLEEREGAAHPTRGGLRIGKKLPERRPTEPFDARLEWDRDGQYFHYLTKWMHALDQVSRATHDPRFNRWARELAEVAHAAFTHGPPGPGRRMTWKMSTDLSRPLVPSMGQHDPLEGYVTCLQLDATARLLSNPGDGPSLGECALDFAALLRARDFATADPLGLGGLLLDAGRIAQLEPGASPSGGKLLEMLLQAALSGLERYAQQDELGQAASRRLAFRELGLAIGLHALALIDRETHEKPDRFSGHPDLSGHLEALAPYVALGPAIASFWLDAENRRTRMWAEHRDINEVMLATSLVPEGCLILLPMP